MVSFISNMDKFTCKKSFKSLALVAGIAIGLMIPSQSAHAAVAAGCDSAFMDTMKQKAWMEAQRELMIAQTIIAKPDSVFALGCFGHFKNAYKVQFSQGTPYDINNQVTEFVNAAFPHKYGGGHFTSSSNNKGMNTTCDMISQLWNEARKADLDIPTPLLSNLPEIAKYKRGKFPEEITEPPGYGSIGDEKSPLGVFYGPKVPKKSANADFDDMDLFAGVVSPASQLSGNCAKGIPTGISVKVSGTARPEIICPNPGCFSDGEATPKCCDYGGNKCSATYTPPPN